MLLSKGSYEGAIRDGALRKHGDLGLGTFENRDGKMVILDGHFFQVLSDGSVREAGDDVESFCRGHAFQI
jgi:acetolactate decarboxylase